MEKCYLSRFVNSDKFDQYSKETTPLNQILGGYLRSTVRCLACHHLSTTYQHFQVWNLVPGYLRITLILITHKDLSSGKENIAKIRLVVFEILMVFIFSLLAVTLFFIINISVFLQDLLLDIRKHSTLDEALDSFFSRERLEDLGYKCEACNKKVNVLNCLSQNTMFGSQPYVCNVCVCVCEYQAQYQGSCYKNLCNFIFF